MITRGNYFEDETKLEKSKLTKNEQLCFAEKITKIQYFQIKIIKRKNNFLKRYKLKQISFFSYIFKKN